MIRNPPPRAEGRVSRDGLSVGYQVFGEGPATVLLLPTWSIVHSDFWRHQVPHLAERYTVVAFDGLGNGDSDRPLTPQAYTEGRVASDAVAILDSLGIERAAALSCSAGGRWGLLLAASEPDRIPASVFIAPALPLGPPTPERAPTYAAFDLPRDSYEGWWKWNRNYWLEDWPGFLAFWFSKCFTEPGSESHIRHFFEMGMETTPEVIAATVADRRFSEADARSLAGSLAGPILVIHGDGDEIAPLQRGQELARIAPDAELVVLPGSGHEPHCRNPETVNPMIDDFLDRHHRSDRPPG